MRIKTEDYEQAAFEMVRRNVLGIRKIKAKGLNHSKVTVENTMRYFPAKWEDANTDGRGWTRHNESKLIKFVELEIKLAKAGMRSY